MKNFLYALGGALALIIGTVVVTHVSKDASTVQAEPGC